MWTAIISAVASLIPMLIKIVLYFIEKKQNADEIREELLRFIVNVEKQMPIKVNDSYRSQLERIKEKIVIEKAAYEKAQRELNNVN